MCISKVSGNLLRSTRLQMRALHQIKQNLESNDILHVALDHDKLQKSTKRVVTKQQIKAMAANQQ